MAFLSLLMIFKVFVALIAVRLIEIVVQVYKAVVVTPERLRSELRKRGIDGPRPSLLVGNVREIKKARAAAAAAARGGGSDDEQQTTVSHNCDSLLFPFLHRWRQQYGPTFVFSLGPMQILHIGSTDVVKQITTCTSLDLGKPSRQQQVYAPLLGQGILTSNGPTWAHQRKVLAPDLYMDRVKGMVKFMAESSLNLIDLWKNKVECSGGVVEIKIDEYMRSFSGDVISKACFGSNFSKGQEIFGKLRELQEAMSKRGLSSNLQILRCLPTKSNREVWRLEKEVGELILKVAKEREEEAEPAEDLLQTILESARNDKLGKETMERFIVDNCKNIYLAGYETTAVAATWTLMLLAINPHWQERVRVEVLQLLCGSGTPDFDMIRHMKKLNMVINESLRLYPPVSVISREALEDLKLGHLEVPKGANLWAVTATLHQDPEIWGPDSAEFKPERFVNGVSGACKLPHVYMPFGAGPRTCLGQNFAMVELKILLSLLLINFSFSLSKTYKHQPTLNLVTEPEFGVHLLVKKLSD